ncbi:MAG: MBOAT family protein, partial [Alphaproteobacteria bacterium]|nr:MBOAT family protein [Alphaproteobacteria bacterium]
IAFLVDSFKNRYVKNDFINYSLFVSYFPHLICGPIILFKNIYPQLTDKNKFDTSVNSIVLFFFIFSIGLFKKCCLADVLGDYSVQLFDASPGAQFTTRAALLGAASYALQLYFDFSGYSDMAVAISSLFGIKIPYNFNAPYQATSIIEFWRRWHISLSSFLRDYVYIPLGGNRGHLSMRYRNILLTMGIGGIWHGAAWTFLIWGLYHGVLLILNHEFRRYKGVSTEAPSQLKSIFSMCVVFCLVTLGWILFRSPSLEYAANVYKSLIGFYNAEGRSIELSAGQARLLLVPLFIAFAIPDTLSLKEHFEKYIQNLQAKKVVACAVICSVLCFLSLLRLNKVQYFLYSQF